MDCLLCGGPLPPRPWWKRFVPMPPTHNPRGPDRETCWQGFNLRMGLDPDRPMPDP